MKHFEDFSLLFSEVDSVGLFYHALLLEIKLGVATAVGIEDCWPSFSWRCSLLFVMILDGFALSSKSFKIPN